MIESNFVYCEMFGVCLQENGVVMCISLVISTFCFLCFLLPESNTQAIVHVSTGACINYLVPGHGKQIFIH